MRFLIAIIDRRRLIWIAICLTLWPFHRSAAEVIERDISRESVFVPNRGQNSHEVLFSSRNKGEFPASMRDAN